MSEFNVQKFAMALWAFSWREGLKDARSLLVLCMELMGDFDETWVGSCEILGPLKGAP